MDKKLHIKAIASHTIKVDAYWYKYGDKMDCYMTPNQFKDIALSGGFEDFDIILEEDNSPKSITIPDEEVKVHEPVQEPVKNEGSGTRKSTKKTSVQ